MANKKEEKAFHEKMSISEIIEYCETVLEISFQIMSKEEAKDFLQNSNFFFRVIQYAQAWEDTTANGKYKGLDFAHLVELSTIDMFFRKLILKMTLDFEHYLKLVLVNECQNNLADDGYEIVKSFLKNNPKIKVAVKSIAKSYNYSGINFNEYLSKLGVWTFVELIGFNDLISFYEFYYKFFRNEYKYTRHFDAVRRLRNASAHNVCLLCSFKPVQGFKHDLESTFELLQAKLKVGQGVISNCMKVPLLNDFAVMLSVYSKIVASQSVKNHTFTELKDFFAGRALRRKELFENIINVKNAYNFVTAIMDYYCENTLTE